MNDNIRTTGIRRKWKISCSSAHPVGSVINHHFLCDIDNSFTVIKLGGRMKNILVAALVFIVVGTMLFGCGSSQQTSAPPAPQAPEWVTKPPRDSNAIYGVGIANVGANVVLARQKAEDAARQEIAKVIDTRVKNMMDRFMQEHQDMINTASSTSVEFTRSVSRSVSQATLSGCQMQEVWHDRDNRIMYALAIITKTDIVKQVKSNVAAQRQAAFLEQKTDDALKAMDKALDNWDVNK